MKKLGQKNSGKLARLIKQHVSNNKKEYFVITLIFIIGIFLGVLFVNNLSQPDDITSYIKQFSDNAKNIGDIDYFSMLKQSIQDNLFLTAIIWFFGTTLIGIPVVFAVILYQGFLLGYTISVITLSFGLVKGTMFTLSSLLLQNIIFIPAIIALGVSGMKLYKAVVKNRNTENIKSEILRHTLFSLIMLLVLLVSSVIEIFISTNITLWVIKIL